MSQRLSFVTNARFSDYTVNVHCMYCAVANAAVVLMRALFVSRQLHRDFCELRDGSRSSAINRNRGVRYVEEVGGTFSTRVRSIATARALQED